LANTKKKGGKCWPGNRALLPHNLGVQIFELYKKAHTHKIKFPKRRPKKGRAEQAIDFIENTTPKSAARIFYNRN